MNIKYLLFAVYILIFSLSISAQNNLKVNQFSELKLNNKKSFVNYGFELMLHSEIHNNVKFTPVVFGFLDLDLYDEVYYLKNEAGVVLDFDSGRNPSFYGSSGLSINIYKPDEYNSIFFHAAMITVIGKNGGGVSFFFSMRYLRKLSQKTAIVTSLRYPMGNLESIALTLGIQF